MPKTRLLHVCVLALGFVFAFPAFAEEIAGMVQTIDGERGLTIENAATGSKRPVRAGDQIFENDRIVTGPNQTVTIELAEQSEIVIAPQSSFLIEKYRGGGRQTSILKLGYGIVRAWVRKAYQANETFAIKTRSATMGVRGTKFIVECSQSSGETVLHTLQGKVMMGLSLESLSNASQSVMVGAGLTSAVRSVGSAPESPQAFDSTQLQQRLQKASPAFERTVSPDLKSVGGAHNSHQQDGSKKQLRSGDGSGENLTMEQKIERAKERMGQGSQGKGQGAEKGHGISEGRGKGNAQSQDQGKGADDDSEQNKFRTGRANRAESEEGDSQKPMALKTRGRTGDKGNGRQGMRRFGGSAMGGGPALGTRMPLPYPGTSTLTAPTTGTIKPPTTTTSPTLSTSSPPPTYPTKTLSPTTTTYTAPTKTLTTTTTKTLSTTTTTTKTPTTTSTPSPIIKR